MMRESFLEQSSTLKPVNPFYKALGLAVAGLTLTACVPSGERGTLASEGQTEITASTDNVIDLTGTPVNEFLPSSSVDASAEILEKSEEEYTEYILGPERASKLQDALNEQTGQLLEAIAENPNLYVFTRKDNGAEGTSSLVRVEAIDSLGRKMIFNVFGHADEMSPLRVPITMSDTQSGFEAEEAFGFVPYAISYSVFEYNSVSNSEVLREEVAISLYSKDRETLVTAVSDMQEDGLISYIVWPFGIEEYTDGVESSLPEFDLGRAVLIDNMAVERVSRAFVAAEDMVSSGRLPVSE